MLFRSAKEIFSGLKRLTRVSLSGTLGLLTASAWKPNYEAAKAAYNSEIAKIKSEYAGAKMSSIKALMTNDLFAIGLFYAPALTLVVRSANENRNRKNDGMLLEEEGEKERSKKVKLPPVPEELTAKARDATDEYFKKIKNDLSKVKNAKNLQDLNASKEAVAQLSAELSKLTDEKSRKETEDQFLNAAKEQIFIESLKSLKQERDKMMKLMKNAGISSSDILSPSGLPARYSQEITKIASMIGISSKSD